MEPITLPSGPRPRGCIRLHPLMLDRDDRRFYVFGTEVALSVVEFDLMALLMERPRVVLDRSTLLREVWGGYCSARTLESTVMRIRRKVKLAGGPRVPESVRGYGYRLGLAAPPRMAA